MWCSMVEVAGVFGPDAVSGGRMWESLSKRAGVADGAGVTTEHEAMHRALHLALKGWGRVVPNPLVGAVLLRDGNVVGEGYHAEFGGPHAEISALESADDPGGATCVVNLEPCGHQGKTPPCVDALIESMVKRVIIGILDPSPNGGGGAERLREAGIEVEIGLHAAEAAALNAPFLWTHRRSRPFVALKVATSLDGYLADAHGSAKWISGPGARDWVHWLRAGFDAIAVGRRTAEGDDPMLTARGPLAPRVPPTRVVFSRGPLRTNLGIVRTAGEVPTVVVTESAWQRRLEESLTGTSVRVLAAEGRAGALEALWNEGIRSVLVEGGGNLGTALLADGLVDRLYWVQAPIWLGSGTRAFGESPATPLAEVVPWTVTERRGIDRDTLLVLDRELCLPAS